MNMSYVQTINALKRSTTEFDGQLRKFVKPVSTGITGGQYSPLLLPDLAKFKKASDLTEDLAQLRSGNGVASKDLTTEDVLNVQRKIEYWGRDVSMEQLIPQNADPKKAFIYFHGGSFYGGSTGDVGDMLKLVAEKSHTQVINVNYHLAPEHPYPSGILDGVAVCLYFQKQLGVDQVILGGDSAGGNIALAVNNMMNYFGYNAPVGNVLLYPVVTLDDDETKDLWDLNAYPIKKDQIFIRNNYREFFMQLNQVMRQFYLQHDEDPRYGLISPLYSDTSSKKPSTLMIVGEYDFFRLQDESYAQKLQDNGTNIRFVQYNGMAHAFAPQVGVLPQADDSAEEMAQFIKSI
jgi:acetyl esterase/lipase